MENKKIKELNKAIRTLKENCGNFNSPCEGCYFKKDRRCNLQNQPPLWWEEIKEPIEITMLEKEVLERVKAKGFSYIARDENKKILAYDEEPEKISFGWKARRNRCHNLYIFNDLFSFVNWEDEEPTKIDDVLKDCIVVKE